MLPQGNQTTIQQENNRLKQRNCQLQNAISQLRNIINFSDQILVEMRKSIDQMIHQSTGAVRSFSIVDRSLQENSKSRGGFGIRRGLSYEISSQIDEDIMDILIKIQQEINSIFHQHHSTLRSLAQQHQTNQHSIKNKVQANKIDASTMRALLIKEIGVIQPQTYSIPVQLIMLSDGANNIKQIAEIIQGKDDQPNESIQQKSNELSDMQLARDSYKKQVEKLLVEIRSLQQENRKLRWEIKNQSRYDECQFQIQITSPCFAVATPTSHENMEIPIQLLIENEASPHLQISVSEEVTFTHQQQANGKQIEQMKTKTDLASSEDIDCSNCHPIQNINKKTDSVVTISEEQDSEPRANRDINQSRIFIQDFLEDAGQTTTDKHKIVEIPLEIVKIVEIPVEVIWQKVKYIEVPIIQQIEVIQIIEVPLQIIPEKESNQHLHDCIISMEEQANCKQSQQQEQIIPKIQANVDEHQLVSNQQGQANTRQDIRQKQFMMPQIAGKNEEKMQISTYRPPLTQNWPQIGKFRIMEVPLHLYEERIVQVPVQLLVEVQKNINIQKIIEIPVEVLTEVQKIVYIDKVIEVVKESIREVPVEVIVQKIIEKPTFVEVIKLIEIPIEVELQKDSIDQAELQNEIKRREENGLGEGQTNLRKEQGPVSQFHKLIQIPIQLQMEDEEMANRLELYKRQIEKYRSEIESLQRLIDNLQQIMLESSQEKEELTFELENKTFNEELLIKRIEDKDTMIMKKEEEIQNVIKNHHENMKLFQSYKEEYCNFIHNIIENSSPHYLPKTIDDELNYSISLQHQQLTKSANNQINTARTNFQLLRDNEESIGRIQTGIGSNAIQTSTTFVQTDFVYGRGQFLQLGQIQPIQLIDEEELLNRQVACLNNANSDQMGLVLNLPMQQERPRTLEEDMIADQNQTEVMDLPANNEIEKIVIKDNSTLQRQQQNDGQVYAEMQRYRQLYYETNHDNLLLKVEIDKLMGQHQQQIKKIEEHVCSQSNQIRQKEREIDEHKNAVQECLVNLANQEKKLDLVESEYEKERADNIALEESLTREMQRLKSIIADKIETIKDFKLDYYQQQQLFQAEIHKLRQELTEKETRIEQLEVQNQKRTAKYQKLIEQYEELKSFASTQSDNQAKTTAIYQQEFQKIRQYFDDERNRMAMELQQSSKQKDDLNLQLQRQCKSNQILIQKHQILSLKLADIQQQLSNLQNEARQRQSQHIGKICEQDQEIMYLKQLLEEKEAIIGKLNEEEEKLNESQNAEDLQSVQSIHSRIRMEYLSRIKTEEEEDSKFNRQYIRKLESLLLKYEQIAATTQATVEQLQEKVCEYLSDALLREQETDTLYCKIIGYQNMASNLMVQKVTLQMENKRLARMIEISDRKIYALGRQLIEATAKLNQQYDDQEDGIS